MDNVFFAIKFKQLDLSITEDPEILLSQSKIKNEAERLVNSMVLSVGGKPLGIHESDFLFEIPLDQANTIKDIHTRIEDDLEVSSTIGVGDTITDAKKALTWASENKPGTIKVFEPAIDEKNEESRLKLNPEEVALDAQGRPIQVKKSEDSWAEDNPSINEETKQKIFNIIQTLQSKKEYLEKLKETSPDVYSGVIAIIQSISSLAQSAKETDAKKQSKLMTQIAHHLDSAEQDTMEGESSKVLELLIQAQNEAKIKKEEEDRLRFIAAKYRHQARHKEARKYSKETGLSVKFIMNLQRALRK